MEPNSLPVKLADIRAWCRLDANEDDDTLTALMCAASQYASTYTGRELTADCPKPIKHAIATMVADWYTNREGQHVGSLAVQRLLDPYRTLGL